MYYFVKPAHVDKKRLGNKMLEVNDTGQNTRILIFP